jgi:hypothetical protein
MCPWCFLFPTCAHIPLSWSRVQYASPVINSIRLVFIFIHIFLYVCILKQGAKLFMYNCMLSLTEVCHLCAVLEPLSGCRPVSSDEIDKLGTFWATKKGLWGLLGITMGEQCLRPNKCSKLKIFLGFTIICTLIMWTWLRFVYTNGFVFYSFRTWFSIFKFN